MFNLLILLYYKINMLLYKNVICATECSCCIVLLLLRNSSGLIVMIFIRFFTQKLYCAFFLIFVYYTSVDEIQIETGTPRTMYVL